MPAPVLYWLKGRRCVIMANLLRCYRHSGLVMYFSTLPAPSASAPCILAILTHLRVRVKICILTHPLSAVAATAATPMMRRACRVCRNGTTAPPAKHKPAGRTPACCRSITDRLACCCSTPTRTGTERTKNSSANHYTMEQTWCAPPFHTFLLKLQLLFLPQGQASFIIYLLFPQ